MCNVQAMWVMRVHHDRGAGKVVVPIVIEVVEWDGERSEGLEVCFWMGHAEEGCGAEGVYEEGGAATDGVAETVEELEAWWGGIVHQVHV